VAAGSNAAASNSITVQMAIIISLRKITKEPLGVSGDAKLARDGLVSVRQAVAATKQ
jgi:hypothetical protein